MDGFAGRDEEEEEEEEIIKIRSIETGMLFFATLRLLSGSLS